MVTLLDLPSELVAHIVALSALPDASSDALDRTRLRQHVWTLSVVCRDWARTAQRFLLGPDPVRVFHLRQLAPLVELAAGPNAREDGILSLVRALDVELWGQEHGAELTRVLERCTGLEELVVTHVERLHLADCAAYAHNLSALSFRQCTLVSAWFPLLDPPATLPSPRPVFASLTRLDLRLCSLRRDFVPFSLADRSYRPLPNLQHLLLHTGMHDQSPATVRALVRSVAPQLRSLSLDYTADELIFPPFEDGESLAFPQLRTLGMYWDAAYSRLVGLSRFVLGPSTSSDPSSRTPLPPYLHVALYPAALDGLRATLVSALESRSMRASMRGWRAVECLCVEGTLRDLDLTREEWEGANTDEDEVGEVHTREDKPTQALVDAAEAAGVCLVLEPASDDSEDGGGPKRATFERGFGTSFWRFVREVDEEDKVLIRTWSRAAE
ncbi:uncharacterized protein JCM10292_004656 [Rhodotorula paludigena]|uniref:uncharacterized protein n=1 Tax=Rhodotorula paludigena TaxID=86838 RepID=UPI0031811050